MRIAEIVVTGAALAVACGGQTASVPTSAQATAKHTPVLILAGAPFETQALFAAFNSQAASGTRCALRTIGSNCFVEDCRANLTGTPTGARLGEISIGSSDPLIFAADPETGFYPRYSVLTPPAGFAFGNPGLLTTSGADVPAFRVTLPNSPLYWMGRPNARVVMLGADFAADWWPMAGPAVIYLSQVARTTAIAPPPSVSVVCVFEDAAAAAGVVPAEAISLFEPSASPPTTDDTEVVGAVGERGCESRVCHGSSGSAPLLRIA